MEVVWFWRSCRTKPVLQGFLQGSGARGGVATPLGPYVAKGTTMQHKQSSWTPCGTPLQPTKAMGGSCGACHTHVVRWVPSHCMKSCRTNRTCRTHRTHRTHRTSFCVHHHASLIWSQGMIFVSSCRTQPQLSFGLLGTFQLQLVMENKAVENGVPQNPQNWQNQQNWQNWAISVGFHPQGNTKNKIK